MRVKIEIDRDVAEEIHFGLADLACWHRGYSAANQGRLNEDAPEGTDQLRRIKHMIDRAITDAKREQSSAESII